jgi:epoxyqueuosine reductase QueG
LDIVERIKQAAQEEGAALVGFAPFKEGNVVVLGYGSDRPLDLESLDESAGKIAKRIQQADFRANVISAADGEGVSLRKLAEKAGLGFIGKSGLLITQEFGPDVRFVGVYTNAKLPLSKKGPETKKGCGGCTVCVVSCPPRAIEVQDVEKCRTFVDRQDETRCTICIDVCPFKVRQ